MRIINKLVFVAWCLFSCNRAVLLERQWKRDRWGCNKERLALAAFIQKNEEQYIGLEVNNLLKLLGKPNLVKTSENGLKRLYYYIDYGDQCSLAVRQDKALLGQWLHGPTLCFTINGSKVHDISMNFS